MDQPVVHSGSISNRGTAVVATRDGSLAAINELAAPKEVALEAKDATYIISQSSEYYG